MGEEFKDERKTWALGKREMLSSSRKELERTAEVAATARCRMLSGFDDGGGVVLCCRGVVLLISHCVVFVDRELK